MEKSTSSQGLVMELQNWTFIPAQFEECCVYQSYAVFVPS